MEEDKFNEENKVSAFGGRVDSQRKKLAGASFFWGFFIEKRPVAWLILIAILIMGYFSYTSLPREIQPEINIPFVAVTTALPGASPTDTESLITDKLEKNISDVANIKTLSSSSGFGFSTIFIEFEANADLEKALQDVKDAVDETKSDLPEDTLNPIVQKAESNTFPVITFSLIATNQPIYELTKMAGEVQKELEKIKDISSVKLLGGQKKFIAINLDQKKIEGLNLSVGQISNIIKFANNNLPIGIIGVDDLNYSIRIDNRVESLDEIQNIPILNGEVGLLVKDIARVEEALPPAIVISKVSVNGKPSSRAVSLQIFRKENTNILKVAEDAKSKIEELKKSDLIPETVEVAVTNDNSFFVQEELGNLTSNGWQTALIIIVVLFLALGLTQGIISGLTIPITFLMTFPILDFFDMSFNTLSLFSLVMSLGITIDTTVVIMEGIYEFLKKGYSPKEAALLSVDTYKWSLIAGTATNIFAFFPLLLVSGILGEFLKTMPITLTATLLTSLFLSLTIAPSIAVRFLKQKKEVKKYNSILEPVFAAIGRRFQRMIRFIIARRFFRILVVLLSFIAFGLSLLLPITGKLKVEMFPITDQNYFTIAIEATSGLVISETKKIAEKVEKYLESIPEVDNFITQIGTSSSIGLSADDRFFQAGSNESHLANITVNLKEKDVRERKSFEISREVREYFEGFTDAKVTVQEIQEGPPSEDPITLRITGENFEKLKEVAKEIQDIIVGVPGTNNVKMSLEHGLDEFRFKLDQDRLAFHGLSAAQVSYFIRNIVQGIEVGDVRVGNEDLSLFVQYDFDKEDGRNIITISDIENFEIPAMKGYSVSLGELADYDFEESANAIEHENQKRIIKVTSAVDADVNVVDVNKKIEEGLREVKLPGGYEIRFGGDLEEINESFRDLFRSMIVGVILVLFTLILMFNSFRQPLIILVTLPLALIGVFPGLYLIGLHLSFPAFLGVVALGGIVVTNGIVLIDRINENRRKGLEFSEAIAEAALGRIEPIILTSLTTILGVIPLASANAFWAGLGYTIAFGQLVSTILVLVVIPILYYSLVKK